MIFLNKFFKFSFFLLLSGCLSFEYNVATHKTDVIFYSTEKEINIGENLARRISSFFKISSNPYYIERVNRIGEKIVQVCDRKEISYYFYVIEEDKKNAFSIPGGYVYIYKGLLDILNDEELAFVIAHEVAHIVSKHAIKKLQASLGANLLIIASSATNDNQFTKGVYLALEQLFS